MRILRFHMDTNLKKQQQKKFLAFCGNTNPEVSVKKGVSIDSTSHFQMY